MLDSDVAHGAAHHHGLPSRNPRLWPASSLRISRAQIQGLVCSEDQGSADFFTVCTLSLTIQQTLDPIAESLMMKLAVAPAEKLLLSIQGLSP